MRGDLLSAARAGDERAFVELTSPSRDELHRHCYRLLGSTTDADDALQETMLRAWQAIGGFEPRAPVRAWLYRIATNVCLRHIERRPHAGGAAAITHLEPGFPQRADPYPRIGLPTTLAAPPAPPGGQQRNGDGDGAVGADPSH